MPPYRGDDPPPESEEELWQRLDEALVMAFRDPVWAWGIAWQVARDADSSDFREIYDSATGLMDVLLGSL